MMRSPRPSTVERGECCGLGCVCRAAGKWNPTGYDVVVTDLSMPGMSGFHLARALLDARADIPILVTSGYVRPQDRDAARTLGVRELILKPDTIDELGHSLARLFAETPRNPQAPA
jgi:CheY-like chemotaxis protein